jgi:peptidoglycan/LPS O-acetylase OafA/YrhL
VTAPAERSVQPLPARLDSLTGLRFLAALMVFGLHQLLLTGGLLAPRHHVLARLLAGGVTGVSFFFVLSGFVLTWGAREDDTALAFYRRRAARLVPAYLVAWLGTLVLDLVAHLPYGGRRGAVASLTLTQAWVPSRAVVFAVEVVGWSLSVEVFCSLVLPWLLPRLRAAGLVARRRVGLACVIATVANAALATTVVQNPAGFPWTVAYFPVARLPEFVLGVVLALEVAEGTLPRIPLAPALLFAAAGVAAAGGRALEWRWAAVTIVPFAVLVVAAAQTDIAGRRSLLRLPPLVRLGDWSYAFYLVHVPVAIAVLRLGGVRTFTDRHPMELAVVFLLASLAVAGLVHEYVERPCELRLRGGRRPSLSRSVARRVLPLPVGLAVCAAIVTGGSAVAAGARAPRQAGTLAAPTVPALGAQVVVAAPGNAAAGPLAEPALAAPRSSAPLPASLSSASAPSAPSGTSVTHVGDLLPSGLPLAVTTACHARLLDTPLCRAALRRAGRLALLAELDGTELGDTELGDTVTGPSSAAPVASSSLPASPLPTAASLPALPPVQPTRHAP